MRAIIIMAVLVLAGCKVTKDEANETVTAEYNQGVAENELGAMTNDVGNLAEDVGNDVQDTANKVGNLDVDVDVKTDGNKAN